MPLSMGALPDWALAYSNVIDPRARGEFGAVDVGDGSATVGNGTGVGVYSGLPDHLFDNFGVGIDATQRINQDRLAEFLSQNQLREAYGPNNQMARWMQDASGNVAGPVDVFSVTDNAFRNAALAAMAVTGANIAAAGAGAGGAAAATPAGTTAGTAAGSTQLTPALIESAVGSAGYGASSAGAGNAMSAAALDSLYNMPQGWQQAGGVAASQALQQPAQTGSPASKQPSPTPGLNLGSGILDYLKSNPRLALGLLGGLLGSQAGGGGSTAPGAAGPAVQWTSGLQMGIQPTAQRATPNALRAPNRFTR